MQRPKDKQPLVTHKIVLRSRYSETDKMGYVYYGNFLQYFEVARTEFVRSLGFSYKYMEDDGIMLPVISTEIQYKEPVKYDEEMHISLFVYDMPAVKLDTYYEIISGDDGRLKTTGRVLLCFMDEKTRKPCRAPNYFLEALHTFLERNG